MNTTKKTAFGITGVAAAALLTVGFAAPAMADTSSDTTSTDTTTSLSALGETVTHLTSALEASDLFDTTAPVNVAPSVGDIGVGDIASGNQAPVLSGNDVSAPVASGNDTSVTAPVASGNEVANNSGNGNSVANPSTEAGNGTSVGTQVGDLTSNIGTEVNDLVDGSLGGLGLGR